jgi:ribose transport system permease protein
VLSVASDAFLTKDNLLNLLDQWAPVGIMACGVTLVFIAGGFDVSIGAIYAAAGVIAAEQANALGVVPGLLCGAGAGLAIGALNGLAVTYGRINPFMGTLASQYIVRGLALAISGGFLVQVELSGFDTLGRGRFLDVRYSVYLWIFIIVVSFVLLHLSKLGRHLYAVGGNAEAAQLSGIAVNRVRGLTYAASGLCAGVAGTVAASRVSTGQADAGIGIEFSVIAAVVIGGTSLLGGVGAVWRTVVGVLILAMISNGFVLLNVSSTYQQMIFGGIILAAVAVDAWTRRA